MNDELPLELITGEQVLQAGDALSHAFLGWCIANRYAFVDVVTESEQNARAEQFAREWNEFVRHTDGAPSP